MARIPRWEIHIRPMFNMMDADHMGYLYDVDRVWTKRRGILTRLKAGSMPPVTEHGPWPEEWIALFERWVTEGETKFGGHPPRVLLAEGSDYKLEDDGFGTLTLTGKTKVPSNDSKAYFFAKLLTDPIQEYYVYFEAPGMSGPPTIDLHLLGTVNRTAGLREIVVHALNGVERLAVPPATS